MKYVNADAHQTFLGAQGTDSPVVYVIDLPEYPFDITPLTNGRNVTIVKIPVNNWDDSLTPWPAPGLYRGDADFKGEASVTLSELISTAIPEIEAAESLHPEKRAICGYSLGGLFSLYALTHADFFDACACLSGSVWYEGWVDHLRTINVDVTGKFAFLSIGSKEKRANPPILHCVQDNMALCAEILRDHGCTAVYSVGPGDHMHYHLERFKAGLDALDAFLA